VVFPEVNIQSPKELQDHVKAFVARPFDLARGPLFRVEMLYTWDGRRLLLSCMHEIIADGSSTPVLQREVTEWLRAESLGTAPRLPELTAQYKDFAAWQNALLSAGPGDASRRYWHEQLGSHIPRLQLPFDWAPTPSTSNSGARYQFAMSGATLEYLKSLCLVHRATPFMLLQATLSVLLSRLTGQRDIAMVTPVAGRNAAEVQPLIGFFLNTLLLRTQVDPNERFVDFLMRAREVTLQALQHQHYPFEQLIEELDLPRPVNQFPATPILFNVLNFWDQDTPYRAQSSGHAPIEQDMKVELEFTLQEEADKLIFQCDYRTALFKPATIEYLMGQWQALLEQVARAPQTKLASFDLFTAPDAMALQSPYLRFAGDLPRPAAPMPVLLRLRQWVNTAPQAIALEWQDQQWSYERLNVESNRVASQLSQLGLRRGDVVGLLLDHPLVHIASVIGVMKAGGVFVTLDHSDPLARLSGLVEAASPAWWVTERAAAHALADIATEAATPLRGIWIGEGAPLSGLEPLSEACQAVDIPQRPVDPCYIFFTSGSSGKPKPILGQVQSLAHFIDWEIGAFQLDHRCRVSQLTAPTFDAFLRDLFVPLCTGGTLCLPPSRKIAPDQLLNWLDQARVSLAHCVPSVLRALLAYVQLEPECLAGGRLASLQRICLSGEVLLPATVQAWRDRFGASVELVNFYGASETTMIRCYHRIMEEDLARGFIPVGKPISHTEVVVLDTAGLPCPVGTPGEIFFRSPFFTLGYYRDPELTAIVFVPNPLRPETGERVYRTGDVGVVLPDGSLRFLGRRDGQVKVNGVRIEIGEIENALLSHPQITEAAVIARVADDGATSLHAYLVASEPPSLAWRDFLAGRLPANLVPQSFTEIESLPMTSSGKVDRKALSQHSVSPLQSIATYSSPSSATEKTLVTLYEDILERSNIGIHDDFFALGGHSLRALLLLSRIRKALDVEVALRLLFEAPTVAQLAGVVDGLASAASADNGSLESLLSEVADELESLIKPGD
jgi:amino acid adenylation domain-containing protein